MLFSVSFTLILYTYFGFIWFGSVCNWPKPITVVKIGVWIMKRIRKAAKIEHNECFGLYVDIDR